MPRGEDPVGAIGSHWFESAADHLGAAYLRYAFAQGTRQEVDFLLAQLQLSPGAQILDVGCGPGRHSIELAERGFSVVGVDISERFVDIANETAFQLGVPATFVRRDARALEFHDQFDAVISLCQGAFGLQGQTGEESWSAVDGDATVLEQIAQSLRPGGKVALSAFSAYFQVRYLEANDSFDAMNGVNHERTELRNPQGVRIEHDLWTTCFTPRELRMLAQRVGLNATNIFSVTPGRYQAVAPNIETPEFLLFAAKV